jgi:hypothetical protein
MEKPLIKSSSFPKELIIGCGIGGIELAKRLKGKEVEIIMLARHNCSLITSLLKDHFKMLYPCLFKLFTCLFKSEFSI